MARPAGVAVTFNAEDAVVPGAPRGCTGAGTRAVDVVPKHIRVNGVDREDAVPFEVAAVRLNMPVALYGPKATGNPGIRNFSVHIAGGSPRPRRHARASPPMAKED